MLKLNKDQRAALACKIYSQIEETYIPQREAALVSIQPKIDALQKELEEFDWDCKYSKTNVVVSRLEATLKFTIDGNEFTVKDDYVSKNRIDSSIEGIKQSVKSRIAKVYSPKTTAERIEQDLILESIEATNLDSLAQGFISKYSYQ